MFVCKECGGERIMKTEFGFKKIITETLHDGKAYRTSEYENDGTIFECNTCGNKAETYEQLTKWSDEK